MPLPPYVTLPRERTTPGAGSAREERGGGALGARSVPEHRGDRVAEPLEVWDELVEVGNLLVGALPARAHRGDRLAAPVEDRDGDGSTVRDVLLAVGRVAELAYLREF